MAMSTSSGSADYGLFDELAEEFAERYRRGERPSLQEYVDRCPEMADEIRELFPALVEVEQAEEVLEGQPRSAASPSAPALRQVGDYRVIREVGRGGMGVVYEAEQVSLGRRVALKILPGVVAKDRKALERFRREARAAARLHHTNIVPVFEVGQDGDVVFYAMQFIQGQGLDVVIDELARPAAEVGPRVRRAGRRRSRGAEAWPAGHNPARANRRLVEEPGLAAGSRPHRGPGRLRCGRGRSAGWRGRWSPGPSRPRSSIRTGPAHRTAWPRPMRVTALPPARPSGHLRPGFVGLVRFDLGRAAGRDAGLGGRVVGPAAAVLPQRGPDRPAGGAGAGLRPCPGHHPPRHQAVEPAAGYRRSGLDRRLRPGQGRRRRADGHRRHPGHDPLHGPGAVPRRGRRPRRRLCPRADPLRAADAPPGVRVVRPAPDDRADQDRGAGAAATRWTTGSRATWRRSS